jgi:hypothetical protein
MNRDAIKIDSDALIETLVPVVLLDYGSIFRYEHGIGIRIDDGWITIDDNCVTAYTDAEYEENNTTRSLFDSVRPVPDFMLQLILKRIK